MTQKICTCGHTEAQHVQVVARDGTIKRGRCMKCDCPFFMDKAIFNEEVPDA